MGNTILAKGGNHILAKRDNSAWPKGSKLSGFSTIGTNYNQCVRALKSNFSEKKALAFLYKLERHTLELVELSKRISALVEEFRSKYPVR